MTRERLPNRRPSVTTRVLYNGEQYHVSYGLYFDGRLGDVFVYGHKTGSDMRVAALESSVLLSFALQHGADPAAMLSALPRTADDAPEGLLGAVLAAWFDQFAGVDPPAVSTAMALPVPANDNVPLAA